MMAAVVAVQYQGRPGSLIISQPFYDVVLSKTSFANTAQGHITQSAGFYPLTASAPVGFPQPS